MAQERVAAVPTAHGGVAVRLVRAEATLPLRQRVLRPHQRVQDVLLAAEQAPDAVHVAAMVPDGDVVGTAAVMPESFPLRPDRVGAWRLRGMATDPALRGRGIGGEVLRFAIAEVGRRGGRLLWCYARIPARVFYERAGFEPIGEPWPAEHLGPHIAMYREIAADGSGPDRRATCSNG